MKHLSLLSLLLLGAASVSAQTDVASAQTNDSLPQPYISRMATAVDSVPTVRSVAPENIDSVFTNLPSELMPLLARNDRLDLLDYHKAGMEARVTNLLGGTTALVERNDTTLSLQLTSVSCWRLTLVPDPRGVVRFRITKTFSLPDEWQREDWYDADYQLLKP